MYYTFPVERIFHAVQEELPKAQTVDLLQGFENGLQKEIQQVDHDGAWTQVAEVSPSGQVTLSVTYCQFLLLLCHIGLIVHDSIAVESALAELTDDELDQYRRELAMYGPLTQILRDVPNVETAVKYSSHLIDLARPLLTSKPISQAEFDALINEVDYNSPLVTRANSLCVYGIVFILLHEASHVILNQDLLSNGNEQDEVEADHNAFWAMWGDLKDVERNTAMMGCICALASLLFFNPSMASDGVHPREDERLFSFYDILKEEKKSYTEMLVILLAVWATVFYVTDFPILQGTYEETLAKQRAFLAGIGNDT